MLKKIAICSDFLMTNENEQNSNNRWVYDLLKLPIYQATQIEPVIFLSRDGIKGNNFNRKLFFKYSSIEYDKRKKQLFFKYEDITKSSLDYLQEYITDDILFIGYEFSKDTRKILNRLKIKYIDIWLHPIRFLDDILFGFSSNDKMIYEKLRDFNVDSDIYKLYASRLKIQTYRGYVRPKYNIKKDSALFVGQTLEDKAVLRDGKMLNILDFKDELNKVSKRYSHIYYSRHPYVKSGDSEIISYLNTLPNLSIVDWPAYHMVADDNLSYVFSISSSVVFEAQAFGKESNFLYKPVISFSTKFDIDSYITIYQEFISPHFWGNILNEHFTIYNNKRIMFLSEKDKLRDMLAFYWSYKHIDKTEYMRQEKIKVIGKSNTNKTAKTSLAMPNIIDKDKVIEQVKSEINANDVISFDIFDTLLLRNLAVPNDIFKLMEDDVYKITDKIKDFYNERINIRNEADKSNYLNEELLLYQRYKLIGTKFNLSEKEVNLLYELELKYEKRFIKIRPFVYELYNYALSKGKKIILISDIFYEEDFVKELLIDNGIKEYNKLYLSSVTGLLKHSSKMYEYVLSDLDIDASRILHIGDNYKSDITNAKKYNLNTLYIPSVYNSNIRLGVSQYKNIYNNVKIDTIHNGIISKRLYDNPFIINEKSFINRDIYNLGYALFAPIVLSFAQWILKDIITNNIKNVFFLARDGYVVKKAFDFLVNTYDLDIKTHYIYASRRAINIASIYSTKDIEQLITLNFSPTTLKSLLNNRFGIKLENISKNILEKNNLNSDSVIEYNTDVDKLRSFIFEESVCSLILENSKKERKLLLDYFYDNSLKNDNTLKAIVDIGHNGSLQVGISNLINSNLLRGYYFCTFDGIEQVFEKEMNAKGFYGESLESTDSSNPYIRNILMFELLFQNKDKSFLHFNNINGEIKPVFLDEEYYEARKEFMEILYDGLENYIKNLIPYLDEDFLSLTIEPKNIVEPYINFLEKPRISDLEIFKDIYFENVFSNREYTPIVDSLNPNRSVWKKASQLLEAYQKNRNKPNVKISYFVRLNNYIFNIYNNSTFQKILQKFKSVPFIGDTLLKFKHNILGWR